LPCLKRSRVGHVLRASLVAQRDARPPPAAAPNGAPGSVTWPKWPCGRPNMEGIFPLLASKDGAADRPASDSLWKGRHALQVRRSEREVSQGLVECTLLFWTAIREGRNCGYLASSISGASDSAKPGSSLDQRSRITGGATGRSDAGVLENIPRTRRTDRRPLAFAAELKPKCAFFGLLPR